MHEPSVGDAVTDLGCVLQPCQLGLVLARLLPPQLLHRSGGWCEVDSTAVCESSRTANSQWSPLGDGWLVMEHLFLSQSPPEFESICACFIYVEAF